MPQKRYAYLIGANGPEHQNITPLQYAEKDIERLQRALSDYPCEFSDVKSVIATSPSNVLMGLERLATSCERSDLLIVHFSGHGKVWGGTLYLICNDRGQHIQSCFLFAKLRNWLVEPDEPSCSNAYHRGSYKERCYPQFNTFLLSPLARALEESSGISVLLSVHFSS